MDWNWLFSTVAQSSAAIVGIFGAFLISRILSNQSDYSSNIRLMKNLKIEAERLKDKSNNRYFIWYNDHQNEIGFEDIEEILKENPDKELNYEDYEKIFFENKFSKYSDSEKVIEKINTLRMKFVEEYKTEQEIIRKRQREEKERAELRARQTAITSKFGLNNLTSMFDDLTNMRGTEVSMSMRSVFPKFTNDTLIDNLREEREEIEDLYVKTKSLANQIVDFIQHIEDNNFSSKQISWLIILVGFLFCAGVIYPISFLPLTPGGDFEISIQNFLPTLMSIKGLFLIIMGAVFFVILGIFYNLNSKMAYSSVEVDKLREYSKVENFSVFFKNFHKYNVLNRIYIERLNSSERI
jgi:hypothetical protein